MKIENIETARLILRGFTKEDALWAYNIWNNPEMGQYLPDEAKEGIDYEYLKQLEVLGDDEECCYLIPIFKDSHERVGTCSFMMSEDHKIYDIAFQCGFTDQRSFNRVFKKWTGITPREYRQTSRSTVAK